MIGIGSIVAGVVGFSIPVVGMVVARPGIYLGIRAAFLGRSANYLPSTTCGVIGTILCCLSIAFGRKRFFLKKEAKTLAIGQTR